MKFLKKLFYFICVLIMLGCALILVFAFQPSLTESLANALYGQQEESAVGGMGDESDTGSNNAGGIASVAGTVSTTTPAPDGAGEGSYIPPDREEIVPPENVNGRSGYEPVAQDGEEIAEQEATGLQEQLDVGATGEKLAFDSQLYPFYAMLNGDMQTLYRQIYANALELTDSFAPVVAVNTSELQNVFEAVYNDHPELFYLETGYSCKYLRSGECIEITLKYNRTIDNIERSRNDFEARVQSIVSGAAGLQNDYEKEKYAHDAILAAADYATSAEMNQSAYSALVNGSTVCAGYARAFQYVMQQMGIPCYYCTGYSGENHAWNIVKLGDGYYNVDTTWDDTEPATYDYFNKTDSDFAATHARTGLSVYLPPCGATAYRNTEGSAASPAVPESPQPDSQLQPSQPGEENGHEPKTLSESQQPPMEWQGNGQNDDTSTEGNLTEAGITADQVSDTLEAYYADCLTQMVAAGTGARQFSNVIPASLWDTIERAYITEGYGDGYARRGMEQLGVENFTVDVQAINLGGGYYRLYHNIATW